MVDRKAGEPRPVFLDKSNKPRPSLREQMEADLEKQRKALELQKNTKKPVMAEPERDIFLSETRTATSVPV